MVQEDSTKTEATSQCVQGIAITVYSVAQFLIYPIRCASKHSLSYTQHVTLVMVTNGQFYNSK